MTNENAYYDDLEYDDLEYDDFFEEEDEAYGFEEDDDDDGYDSEEEDDDDDDDDGEDSGEFFWRKRRKKRRGRYRRPRVARGRGYGRTVSKRYRGIGRIKTPAGTARVKLPSNIATKHEVKRALAAVSKDIKKNAKAIKITDSNLKSLGSEVNKAKLQTRKVKKSLDALQQQQLFTALLGQPQIQELQLSEVDSAGNVITGTTKNYQVDNMQADNSNTMLMAMMSGGGGGGNGNNMNSLLPLLLMQDNNSGNDNTMLLAMMMMNQK